MECVDVSNFTFATWQITPCLLCKFISPGACPSSFPSTLRGFRQEHRIVELFYWSKFIDRKENKIFASQAKNTLKRTRITSLEGRYPPYIAVNRDVEAFTFVAWQIRSRLVRLKRWFLVYLQFCVDFLRPHAIEVNSLAVWSRRVKKFKGKLIICWGKQEQARTCSVYINAQDNHSKFTVIA